MAVVETLGWDRLPLEAAAEWLAERYGERMDGVVVALPGSRAGRRLAEKLARLVGPGWQPPDILTAGLLTDRLVRLDGAPAGRLLRTLTWGKALRELGHEELRRVVARVPDPDDLSSWLRLAERVRGLFGELAAEGLDFDDVAADDAVSNASGEGARWKVLAKAQGRMVELLRAAGRVDPHLGRLEAIQSKAFESPREVVLVGVVDMNGLLRRVLEGIEVPVMALVFAPDDRRDDVDELGCVRPHAVLERGIEIPPARWHTVGGPDSQAACALDVISSWGGRFRAEQISIGVPDAEVVPHLKRRLAAEGVDARDAAGKSMTRSRPVQLMHAASAFLAARSFGEFAALVRHPDLEASVGPRLSREVSELIDAYHVEHLPARVPERGKRDWRGKRGAAMSRLQELVEERLGALADAEPRPVDAWAVPIRAFLIAVYGELELDPDQDTDRELALALRTLGEGCQEIEELGELGVRVAPEVTSAVAIELLLRTLGARRLPPASVQPGQPTIELLGWLELSLDDAPALVITGFEDGLVPETVHGDAFLPDGLRTSLGLVDNRHRLARDLFAAQLMLHSRREVAFVSGRQSRLGDPKLPSRIAFHCHEDGLVDRVAHCLAGAGRTLRPTPPEATPTRALPRGPAHPAIEEMSVTSFTNYLDSPYRFYLERVLRLEVIDDRKREMDPLRFGNLGHAVLEAFGKEEALRECADPKRIHAFLGDRLERLAQERFTTAPLPAVTLQIAQLDRRLETFAEHQARCVRDGWRIEHVEWSPEGGGIVREVDGEPVRIRGRIDRIDTHPDGRWAIWDYKTGENVRDPKHAYVAKENRWRDLQLPLYCLLATELGHERMPTMGVIALGKDPDRSGFVAAHGWNSEVIDEALALADRVVRDVRQGRFWDVGRWKPFEAAFQGVCGLGLVSADPAGEEDEA